MRKLNSLLVITGFLFINQAINACTAVQLHYNNQYVVGHNFDWPNKYTYMVANPVGIHRYAGNLADHGQPLQWVAKYGSVTMNPAGKNNQLDMNLVAAGMNQYGLTAAVLWLGNSSYPKTSAKPELGTTQWTQYLLDNAKSVTEAIQLTKKTKIEPSQFQGEIIPLHIFIHDSSGNAAIIEYINGKFRVYHDKNLPIAVLTNDRYLQSMESTKQYKDFGGHLPLPSGYASAARFVLAANFLKHLPAATSLQQTIAYTFDALGYLIEIPGTESPTQWSAVYDLTNKVIYYRNVDNQQIRYVNLNELNLTAGQPVKALLINNDYSGNIKSYFKAQNFAN